MSDCWHVLKLDKSLLALPFISGICCMVLMASFAVPIFITGAWHPPARDAEAIRQVLYYGALFGMYVVLNLVVVFFNAAIVSCAATRMGGGEPTIGDGLQAAVSRLPVIAGWALIAGTVGLILRIAEDRSDRVGQIIAGVLGTAWTVMTFLVVPVLVIENKNPIAALQESTVLLKRTWGEQVMGNLSFGAIFALLSLPGVALIMLGAMMHNTGVFLACLGLAVIYWILLSLVHSTLRVIFETALYLYVRDGVAPAGFNAEVLGAAMR
jgi:protein-S-isoprenylcysteine O-methyltransferase Ste14